jgi:hypothetical protein
MSFNIVSQLTNKEVEGLVAYLKRLPFTKDKSSYAPNRQILWIDKEPPLYLKHSIKANLKEAYKDETLKELCQSIFPWCEYILISYSSTTEGGINWHRDASYCTSKAATINLGSCKFGYKDTEEHWLNLEAGDIITFNSKQLHCAVPTSNNRYAIHCWEAKDI